MVWVVVGSKTLCGRFFPSGDVEDLEMHADPRGERGGVLDEESEAREGVVVTALVDVRDARKTHVQGRRGDHGEGAVREVLVQNQLLVRVPVRTARAHDFELVLPLELGALRLFLPEVQPERREAAVPLLEAEATARTELCLDRYVSTGRGGHRDSGRTLR